MPTPGLSLVGFMDQPQAILHLRNACVPSPNATDAELIAQWAAAQTRLGPAAMNVGMPDIQDFPASHAAYVNALFQLQWVINEFQGTVTPANVKMVEIDPLLGYQFFVDLQRSGQHCGHISSQPTVDQMVATCLPNAQPNELYAWQRQNNSAIIKSRSLNLRLKRYGIDLVGGSAGILSFGASLPLVQVVRLNGKCLLYNGFHRAVGMRKAGATHIPCILRDVPDAQAAGITDGVTFSEELLMGNNPPSLRHYTQELAADVQIRATSRILHVTWSDYVFPEE